VPWVVARVLKPGSSFVRGGGDQTESRWAVLEICLSLIPTLPASAIEGGSRKINELLGIREIATLSAFFGANRLRLQCKCCTGVIIILFTM
jgi:hypothetical protein